MQERQQLFVRSLQLPTCALEPFSSTCNHSPQPQRRAQRPAATAARHRFGRGQMDRRPSPPAGEQHADRRTAPRRAAKRGTACAAHICRRNECALSASNTLRPREWLHLPAAAPTPPSREGPCEGTYGGNAASSGTNTAPPAPQRGGTRAPARDTQHWSRGAHAGRVYSSPSVIFLL